MGHFNLMLFIDNCRQISYAFSLLCAKISTKAQWGHDFSAVEIHTFSAWNDIDVEYINGIIRVSASLVL
jgi:hypothetical protein